MDPLTTLAGLAIGTLLLVGLGFGFRAAFAYDRKYRDDVADVWRRAGEGLGLALAADGTLQGRFQGFEVRVEHHTGGDGPGFTRVTLLGEGKISGELDLRRERAFSGLGKRLTGEDVLVGAAEFDRVVHVQGPEDVALAALGSRARMRLANWVGFGGELRCGDLTIDLVSAETSPQRIQDAVRDAAGLAAELAFDSVPEALRRNAAEDHAPGARLRSLQALATRHGETRQAREALRAALGDEDLEVRLFAAQQVEGPEAREVLSKIVRDAQLPEPARTGALERLVQAYPWPEVRPVVARALYAKGATVRRAAVRAVGEAKDATLTEDLVSMATTMDGELGEVLARALGRLASGRCEKGLLDLVAASPSVPAQKAALEVLAWLGTIRAVEPLLPLAERGPVAQEARQAVRAIQARLGEADAGRLSMVDETAAGGGLSLGEELRAGGDRAKEKG